jgi:hypothetical protein
MPHQNSDCHFPLQWQSRPQYPRVSCWRNPDADALERVARSLYIRQNRIESKTKFKCTCTKSVHARNSRARSHTHTLTHAHTHTFTRTHTHTHTHTRTHTHTYIHTYIQINTYAHTFIQLHTREMCVTNVPEWRREMSCLENNRAGSPSGEDAGWEGGKEELNKTAAQALCPATSANMLAVSPLLVGKFNKAPPCTSAVHAAMCP